MSHAIPEGVQILGPELPASSAILSPEALAFVAGLQREFGAVRRGLLERRGEMAARIAAGETPRFLEHTRFIREGDWSVAPAPPDLNDRRTEITGPVERKMMINALNSGAKVFMADLEDALSPTWENVVQGQQNLKDAVRKTIRLTTPEGKEYTLNEQTATLVVRPRGWHLLERHVWVDGQPVSASLFDFGLYFFHNAQELLQRGSGPYFYLPKLENHLEARLWNEVFNFAQDSLGLPRGTVRATVLIETVLAAFEMEEILYALKEHAAGLNAGRWDYIFSCIKKFATQDVIFPDRAQVTMTVPFMRAYTELLVRTCHKRGAHAIGGMAAFIPSRRDPEVNERALKAVRADKERESGDGFDGTWVAHPDLVPVALEVFNQVLGEAPNQKHRLREEVRVQPEQLLDFRIPGGKVTEAGVRNNISVGLQYTAAWLGGSGAVAIFNLMEDAATAEISRSQLWQWIHKGAVLEDGRPLTPELYRQLKAEETAKLGGLPRLQEAADLLDSLVLQPQFEEFLTLPAYTHLG
ncbi:malate synthase A [Meiothermus granaticius]|uniref:Malate synthase n=1 Tax=Meiothermus granaticius NBRC 107808 TaxID=1227551 RepID=A0A399F8F7_9DEIN|nr:malate synthase A [Meiothermus granaticius]RIH90921.1 Malate synthase A [Meiothermus granaticius NBRC 107808]GEM87199.1 malate synthase [Meiothermus granaticius NBRC 107808]